MKNKIKRIICFITIIMCLACMIPSGAFAIVGVDDAMIVSAFADAYGMNYGIGTSFNVSNSSEVGNTFQDLWEEFHEYKYNQGYNYPTLSEFAADLDAENNISGFTHSSGKFASFYVDSESAEIFDNFFNWLLSGPAQMQIVDNQFAWNNDQQGLTVHPTVVDNYTFGGYPVTKAPIHQSTSTNDYTWIPKNNSGEVYALNYKDSNGRYFGYIVSLTASELTRITDRTQSTSDFSMTTNTHGNFTYYSKVPSGEVSAPYTEDSQLTVRANIFASAGAVTNESLQLQPYLADPALLNLPIVSSQDYTPSAVTLQTNLPWDDTNYGNVYPLPPLSVQNVINDAVDDISANDFALLNDPQPDNPDDPPPIPSEVFTPLLPIRYPSFNFSFSGIWHYVREWVTSMGIFFTTLFQVWNALPYAMVVPVYATAVVVIVLGVYKRFFM